MRTQVRFVHSQKIVAAALKLGEQGHRSAEIGRRLGVAPRTVRDWMQGKVPGASRTLVVYRPDELPDLYVYLLGVYLGDGCLTAHPRGVFNLRIFMDERYTGIIEECRNAISTVRPGATVKVHPKWGSRAVEICSYWKAWPALLPQHGQGRKHERRIVLEPWQQEMVDRHPGLLLRGLIHSDGCRSINTGRGGWRHPRYSFSNRSDDIRAIFCAACDRLGLRWTTAPHRVYVSRKDDVARLDEFVGPKA